MMGLRFNWDPAKAASNWQKHGVTFEEGVTLFGDPQEVMLPILTMPWKAS